MKGSAGILLVAVGLIALYVVLSGKYQCVTDFIGCMAGSDSQSSSDGFTRSIVPNAQTPTITIPDPYNMPFLRSIFNPDGSIRTPGNDQRPWFK